MTVKIDLLADNCPLQGEGTIDGQPFYFRARGQHWSFGVGADPIGAPDWYRDEPWGDGPFDAGWMPEDEARRIIDRCAVESERPRAPAPGRGGDMSEPSCFRCLHFQQHQPLTFLKPGVCAWQGLLPAWLAPYANSDDYYAPKREIRSRGQVIEQCETFAATADETEEDTKC